MGGAATDERGCAMSLLYTCDPSDVGPPVLQDHVVRHPDGRVLVWCDEDGVAAIVNELNCLLARAEAAEARVPEGWPEGGEARLVSPSALYGEADMFEVWSPTLGWLAVDPADWANTLGTCLVVARRKPEPPKPRTREIAAWDLKPGMTVGTDAAMDDYWLLVRKVTISDRSTQATGVCGGLLLDYSWAPADTPVELVITEEDAG